MAPTNSTTGPTTFAETTTEEPSTAPFRYDYGMCSDKSWYFADDRGVGGYDHDMPAPSFYAPEGISTNTSHTYCCYKYFGARGRGDKFTYKRAQTTCAAVAQKAALDGIRPNFPSVITSGLANFPDPNFMSAFDFINFIDTLRKEKRGIPDSATGNNPDDSWLGLKVRASSWAHYCTQPSRELFKVGPA